MLTEFRDTFGKQNKDRIVIGYDLSNTYAQISYCSMDGEEPETLSVVAGAEEFNIPVLLCKKKSSGQWVCGKEAQKASENGDGVLLRQLLDAALDEKNTMIDGQEYAAIDLLALFIKRSFALLPVMTTPERIEAVIITVRDAGPKLIDVLKRATKVLKIVASRISFITYEESFYYFMLYQMEELQNHQILVCDATRDYLQTYRLERNRNTTPNVAYVERIEYPEFPVCGNRLADEDKDRQFLRILTETCENRIFPGVYLIGEGFYDDWCKESLKFLCRNRRVFKGNNLFSKGACFAAKEKVAESRGKNMLFLGEDKLKSNLGIEVYRRGEKVYLPLMDAGSRWYEAKKEAELILDETDTVPIVITPVNGRGVKIANFLLTDLPERPRRACRIHLSVKMLSESRVWVSIRDMGFGEVALPSGMEWTEEFDL